MIAERGHLVVVDAELVGDVDSEALLCNLEGRGGQLSSHRTSFVIIIATGATAKAEDRDDSRAPDALFYYAQLWLLRSQHILFMNKTGLRYRCVLDRSPFGERNRN